MSHPRVLSVSSDRSTRASVVLALTDAPVNVVVAETSASAIERLECESVDAVTIDASTVANVPRLVDAVEERRPGTPTFVHWGNDGTSVSVLTEVTARVPDEASDDRLVDAITERLGNGEAGSGDEDRSGAAVDLPVERVKRRLADARTPGDVERAVREGVIADDRFAFAWVGEYDSGEREVVPWLTGEGTSAWPMHRTFPIGDGSQPILERAMHTRELQVVQSITENEGLVPLADTALDREARALAVAPLYAEDDLYGVLVVYATERLSSTERESIRRIAETASYSLESVAVRGQLDQLERTLRRYERLVETAGDGMYVLDEDGHFTTVNEALVETTGYSREGLLGEHASLLFDAADVERGSEIVETLVEAERSTDTVEVALTTKDGREIPCETQVAVLVHDGELRGSVGVVRDVTERKRRERKLREQNERLDAFARIVSHDLRNPLGIAQGYLDLLAETGSLEHADRIRDGLDRMETIIGDVLALAQEGGTVAETESVDLESIAEGAWENVSTGRATLAVEGTFAFEADRSRLLRAFENMFRNAVEHGGEAVTVRVGPLSDEEKEDAGGAGSTGFFVADDGRGIPAEIRDRAFDSEFSTGSDGLGIGLWVVREVADGHGWSTAATDSRSGGARFEFTGLER